MNGVTSPTFADMPNTYFQFKQFRIEQAYSGMKVTTDGCLFGAWVADLINQSDTEPKRILDIGTGTGLLALMLAQVTKDSQIEAIEINEEAFEEAQRNFTNSPWSDRLVIHHEALQSFNPEKHYELIICNPPFFKDNLKGAQINKNQAVHNDHLSMEALAGSINRWLEENGVAFVMYPEWESEEFAKRMISFGWYLQHKLIVKHRMDAKPLRVLAAFQKKKAIGSESDLTIRDIDGSYSEAFNKLLVDYYL